MESKIGILGLGSRTTLFYIEQLNAFYNKKNGGYSTFPFKMLNVNFNNYNPYLPSQYERLLPQLQKDLQHLNDLGVKKILIPNITLHQTVDRLPDEFPAKKKIIHPYLLAIEKMQKQGIKEAVILGTIYTMQSVEIRGQFEKAGIQILPPGRDDRIAIDQLRQDAYSNRMEKGQKENFRKIASKYEHPKRAVMLACTELSLLSEMHNDQSVIDLVALQIQKTLDL